jgi:hypothetical protein
MARESGRPHDRFPSESSIRNSNLEGNMKIWFASLMLLATGVCAEDGRSCTNATLKGDFGVVVSGVKPAGPSGLLEQFAGYALTHYDGAGGFTQTGNNHGSITGDTTGDGSGTYSLKPDCTGTGTVQLPGAPPIKFWLMVVDRGREVRLVVQTPVTPAGPMPAFNVVTGNGRKVWPGGE